MAFVIPRGQLLVLTEHAVSQLSRFAQHHFWQREAGGVLLGRHLLESGDMVVDEVTMPQQADRRSRFAFFRSKQHEVLAHAKWEAARQTMAYLGSWHTHPEVNPNPSSVDLSDWEHALKADTYEGNRLFFAIVGTGRIRVWTKTRRGAFNELRERGHRHGRE
jgi:integrative and conjugative element protein (TIGR02256 family)